MSQIEELACDISAIDQTIDIHKRLNVDFTDLLNVKAHLSSSLQAIEDNLLEHENERFVCMHCNTIHDDEITHILCCKDVNIT